MKLDWVLEVLVDWSKWVKCFAISIGPIEFTWNEVRAESLQKSSTRLSGIIGGLE